MWQLQALRQYDAADFGVTAGTLSSLARLAIASARLHLRDTVLALPDAVLAIIMFERSCDSKVSMLRKPISGNCNVSTVFV